MITQVRQDYRAYLLRKQNKYGDKFDSSDLNTEFIPYYENQQRIEVDFGYEIKRGRIGITTGWKPCFLLMLTTRSTGSSYTIGKKDKVLSVVSGR